MPLAVLPLLLLQTAAPTGLDPAEVSTDSLQEIMRGLCEQPRVAGTVEARIATELAAESFRSAGMLVEVDEYWCHLPRQTGQKLMLKLSSSADFVELDLVEVGYAEDPWSLRGQQPPMHGLTGEGVGIGRVVYAGYGTEQEFRRLRALLGDELDGAVALCRYGMLYRGQKVANAEAAGCVAALLYTDQQDDGAVRGEVLPAGPWRPASGIQRGSVYNGDGDPLTPGYPALKSAPRLPASQAIGRVGIPSLPISAANAALLLAGAEKELGMLSTTVHVEVEQDDTLVPVHDVIGVIPGTDRKEEAILIGAHRDSWGFGAVDNGTGSTVLLETARVVGLARARGWQPRRTLVFCSWDAEEWGLVGSTEWVEEHRAELRDKAVAYINLDVAASGPRFGASCTPGLVAALSEAANEEGLTVPSGLGSPGGGSDHVPFLELAGVEVMTFGFSGGSGSYHSAFDTPYLIETFLDPGYVHHRSAARFAVQLLDVLAGRAAKVDGVVGWLDRASRAAAKLPTEDDAQRATRTELVRTLDDARALAEKGAKLAQPWKFHALFLPEQGRSFLWRTDGYGAKWFPALRTAWAYEDTRERELRRLQAAVERALSYEQPTGD